ncbi:MAG: divergent polysaccharide deacetylase family protein [Xanthobacteraceae bacterium]
MSTDDLTAPLGRPPKKRRLGIKIPVPQIIAGALAAFLGAFVLWAVVADDPYGGEPWAVVSANLRLPAKPTNMPGQPPATGPAGSAPHDSQAAAAPGTPPAAPPLAGPAANTTTVTIIDGKTGSHQDIVVPAPVPADGATPAQAAPVDQKFLEMTPHGLIPKIAADGTRPADAFAKPVRTLPGKPDAPRIALIVTGLGVSTSTTADAIAKLPGPVTLGFVPYGADVASVAVRARAAGHELLLQAPMEPFEFPDNDPGPQTLLTSLTPDQNIDRLHWVMSRFQGYVGLINTMGARFTASDASFAPILHEIAKRGLVYVDDGSNPRSVAGRIAGGDNLPFARADVVIDAVPTPADIDHALDRLEMAARERKSAVGIASALPVSIDRIVKWAKTAAQRGLLLVPITAVSMKGKQSSASE